MQSEWVLDVHGLGLAENGNGGSGALRLFVERATQVEPGFSLDDGERVEALRICRLVEGLPLGIELAASWVSMLSCAEIADEIEQNIDFLATSMRDVPERHRSLRAAFDQSWRLLSGEQQDVLARLSVFRGDFGREAAAAVADADLRLLSDLVSKSLVRRSDFGRYELHELLRQYAAEKLAAESPDALADDPRAPCPPLPRSAGRAAGARSSARASCRRATSCARARQPARRRRVGRRQLATSDEAREVLAGLNEFFFAHSWFDGAETFERLAPRPVRRASDIEHASPVTLAAVAYRTVSGAHSATTRSSTELAARVPPPPPRARHDVGARRLPARPRTIACYRDVYPEAVDYLEEAVATARSAGDGLGEVAALSWLGFVQLLLDDLEGARASFEACHATAEELGNPQLLAYALSKLGILADAEERYADAMRLHMEANELFAGVGDVGGAGYALSRASLSAYGLGDYEEALRLGRAGYEAFSEVNHRWGMIAALCRIGFAALALGDVDEAQRSSALRSSGRTPRRRSRSSCSRSAASARCSARRASASRPRRCSPSRSATSSSHRRTASRRARRSRLSRPSSLPSSSPPPGSRRPLQASKTSSRRPSSRSRTRPPDRGLWARFIPDRLPHPNRPTFEPDGAYRDRTDDLRLAKAALSQLS